MANRPDLDDDDDFSEIYKAYTGPLGSSANNIQEKPKVNSKRSQASSDEEEERDPNAVPTDFTSREAKVWEAKSKATERNWKKRKEEEMICKICGESGHFTQGCPSTLGGNRNSQDFFERVAARDKQVRALFTDKVIERIERDNGCKIKMDEKFIIVSGKDRLILRKGVDAVHKVINDECNDRSSPGSHMRRSRSPECSPIGTRFSRSESQRSRSPERSPINRFSRSEPQRSNPSPRNVSQFHQRFGRQDRGLEDRIRGDLQKPSRNSPQGRATKSYACNAVMELAILNEVVNMLSFTEVYGSDGGRGRSSHSRSPARIPYSGCSYIMYEGLYRSQGWEIERQGSDVHSDNKFEHPSLPQTLEEVELEYKREAMDLARHRDKQEDEENLKHREVGVSVHVQMRVHVFVIMRRLAIRELKDSYMERLSGLRGSHAKQWDEFLHLDAQTRQQQVQQQQHMSTARFGGYQPSTFSDYGSLRSQPFAGSNMERRGQYTNPGDNYPHSRPRDAYHDFQHQRLDGGYGRVYNRAQGLTVTYASGA
ncbi:Cytidylate kinase [Bienertia sinuspersici]